MLYAVLCALRLAVGMPLALLGSATYFVYWAFAIGWYATADALGEPD